PSRVVLGTRGADGALPRGFYGPGLPWVQTSAAPVGQGWKELSTMGAGLLWLVSRNTPLADERHREFVAHTIVTAALDPSAIRLVPAAVPGASIVDPGPWYHDPPSGSGPSRLTLAYALDDATARRLVPSLVRAARVFNGLTIQTSAVPTLRELL